MTPLIYAVENEEGGDESRSGDRPPSPIPGAEIPKRVIVGELEITAVSGGEVPGAPCEAQLTHFFTETAFGERHDQECSNVPSPPSGTNDGFLSGKTKQRLNSIREGVQWDDLFNCAIYGDTGPPGTGTAVTKELEAENLITCESPVDRVLIRMARSWGVHVRLTAPVRIDAALAVNFIEPSRREV